MPLHVPLTPFATYHILLLLLGMDTLFFEGARTGRIIRYGSGIIVRHRSSINHSWVL
jgi:uncharacterized membrane protein